MSIINIPVLLAGFLGLSLLRTGDLFLLDKTKTEMGKNNGSAATNPPITIIKKWNMPKELTEISGLSYKDEKHFACVQDELGKIFIYNTASSSVEKEISFGAAGDYEGLAVVDKNYLGIACRWKIV
jgi:hypothetical protein